MKTLSAIVPLLFALLLASCGAKTNVITNTYSTAEPGNVKGTVKLFDTNGAAISDASGVKVAMEGTSYSTLTATDGTWELQNVPAGTYTSLMYSKSGFPTYKSYQSATQGQQGTPGNIGAYIIGGGGTQYDGVQSFYQIGHISAELVIRPFEDYNQVIYRDTNNVNGRVYSIQDTVTVPLGQAVFTGRILDVVKHYYIGMLYLGLSPNIDPTDAKTFLYESCIQDDGTLNTSGFSYIEDTTGSTNFDLHRPLLKSLGFVSGQKIYAVAYFGNYSYAYYNYYNYYFDPATGMIIFPGFGNNHSEVKSFILP